MRCPKCSERHPISRPLSEAVLTDAVEIRESVEKVAVDPVGVPETRPKRPTTGFSAPKRGSERGTKRVFRQALPFRAAR